MTHGKILGNYTGTLVSLNDSLPLGDWAGYNFHGQCVAYFNAKTNATTHTPTSSLNGGDIKVVRFAMNRETFERIVDAVRKKFGIVKTDLTV